MRRPALVALGASLPYLPGVERKGMSFFRRLFTGGGKSARWQKALEGNGAPRPDLVLDLVAGDGGAPGPLARFALGLGVLSHEVLEASIRPISASLPEAQRPAIARGQARIWLQLTVPRMKDLESEWRPVLDLADAEQNRRVFEHVNAGLARVHGQGPGADMLARWTKGLCVEIAPLVEKSALPPEAGMPDHDVRRIAFDGDAAFLAKSNDAIAWFVFLANRLAERFVQPTVDRAALKEALCDGGTALVARPADDEAAQARERWRGWLHGARDEALTRGRNPKPAFQDGDEDGVLPSMPPLPADENQTITQMIPAIAPAHMPPVPTSTQELSSSEVQAALARGGASADGAPTPQGPGAPPPPPGTDADEFAAPAHTQEVSVAQIEESVQAAGAAAEGAPQPGARPGAPSTTQQVSLDQIQEAVAAAGDVAPPSTTQQVSLDQIQEALEAAQSAGSAGGAQADRAAQADVGAQADGGHPPDAASSTTSSTTASTTASTGQPEAQPPADPAQAASPPPAEASATAAPQGASEAAAAPVPEGASSSPFGAAAEGAPPDFTASPAVDAEASSTGAPEHTSPSLATPRPVSVPAGDPQGQGADEGAPAEAAHPVDENGRAVEDAPAGVPADARDAKDAKKENGVGGVHDALRPEHATADPPRE